MTISPAGNGASLFNGGVVARSVSLRSFTWPRRPMTVNGADVDLILSIPWNGPGRFSKPGNSVRNRASWPWAGITTLEVRPVEAPANVERSRLTVIGFADVLANARPLRIFAELPEPEVST